MYVLAHLGIGARVARPFRGTHTAGRARLPLFWILAGTLLPDVLDKSLYYGAAWITGRWGAEIGLISGTRLFGHTALLWVTLLAGAWVLRADSSRRVAAIALGAATHLLLDSLGDALGRAFFLEHLAPRAREMPAGGAFRILLWPFQGVRFPAMVYDSAGEQFTMFKAPHLLATEIFGLYLLWREIARERVGRR